MSPSLLHSPLSLTATKNSKPASLWKKKFIAFLFPGQPCPLLSTKPDMEPGTLPA